MSSKSKSTSKGEMLNQANQLLDNYNYSNYRKKTRRKGPKDIGIRTTNETEIVVCRRLESEGFEVIKRGWPDFIAVRDGEVRFIEVKPEGKDLKSHQKRVAEILLEATGIVVEVVNE